MPSLPKDKPMRSGFLSRTKIKSVEGPGSYTKGEERLGPSKKSTNINLPKGK